MKINELIWFKAIYPRGRDQYNDNEIKIDVENVGKIKDYIALYKKLPQKITYNKNHKVDCPCGQKGYHILDGTHTFVAASESGWKEIKPVDLEVMDIPLEQEMWVSGKLNVSHGKQLSRREIQAIFWMYFDPDERAKYGSLEKFSKDFCVPMGTLREWIVKERGLRDNITSEHSCDHTNSSDINISEDKEKDKLKQELEETREELNKVKTDARQAFWEMICEQHQEAIKGCKNCGK